MKQQIYINLSIAILTIFSFGVIALDSSIKSYKEKALIEAAHIEAAHIGARYSKCLEWYNVEKNGNYSELTLLHIPTLCEGMAKNNKLNFVEYPTEQNTPAEFFERARILYLENLKENNLIKFKKLGFVKEKSGIYKFDSCVWKKNNSELKLVSWMEKSLKEKCKI